jgi:hypothetical protein
VFVGTGLRQGVSLLTWRRVQNWLIAFLLPSHNEEILPRFVEADQRQRVRRGPASSSHRLETSGETSEEAVRADSDQLYSVNRTPQESGTTRA